VRSSISRAEPVQGRAGSQAFYLAIDENAIAQRVMRNAAVPSALMISPLVFDLAKDFKRPAPDAEKAKKLLGEAGYPNGFEVEMDCPNDRYVNDEAICQAVSGDAGARRHQDQSERPAESKYFAKCCSPAATTPRSSCSAGHPAHSTRGTCSTTCTIAATKKASAAT